MIELDTRYRTGTRTFIYLFFRRGWWLIILAVLLLYLSYEMYLGQLQNGAAQFLAAHPDWYVSVGMLSQWSLYAGLGFLLIAYLRASILYREYSFHVDEHALHLRRGLIRVQEITIPFHQISNIHIEQPYHWRLLGLAELDITIASSRTALSKVMKKQDFLIPYIDKSVAKALSHFLVRQASGEEDDTDDEWEEEDDSEDIQIEQTE
ncbi:MAG TPA: PH domain-containing protein [Candidatus Paceibacterota bacterium]|jgi:membrane protein YdbS with pleckstrin-like domain|nr:PH domain-containing protein [Candidatus Paceibacterota bacterium]